MKVVAYYIIHYGKEWLTWSLFSIRDMIDDCLISYTPQPSHGHTSTFQCPESREELRSIAKWFGATWIEGAYGWEGQHRDMAVDYCRFTLGADVVLVVDADELWPLHVLNAAIREIRNNGGSSRLPGKWRIGMRHLWRSVNWVCDDAAMPLRFHDFRPGRDQMLEGYLAPDIIGKVWHMGYAQSPRIIQYKMSIHGHKNEIRPNWYNDKFLGWKPGMGDVHPTCENYWTPVQLDKTTCGLEALIGNHPYNHDGIIY